VTLLALALVVQPMPAYADSPAPCYIRSWGSFGYGEFSNGQFVNPYAIAVASGGTVYVADTGNSRVQAFTSSGAYITKWGGLLPYGVAVAPNGTVFVTDQSADRVQYFSANGAYLGEWGTSGSGNGQFDNPVGIGIATGGSVYVVDSGNHRVQYFTSAGAYLGEWGSMGVSDGQFINPRGLGVAPDGSVYVSQSGRVQYFDAAGGFLGKWTMDTPEGISVASDGTVYVVETFNHTIKLFTSDGTLLGSFGGFGFEEGQLQGPYGVAVTPAGGIYVADRSGHRVVQFAAQGLGFGVIRVGGANRYATAAAVSELHHGCSHTLTVYVATGVNFPDALGGGVAAGAEHAPLLLTGPYPQDAADGFLPGATALELDRLDGVETGIQDVVILGGEGAVSLGTEQVLSYGTVTRLAGGNRYATAIEISQHAFPVDGSADVVVIATGLNFPDALAAAPLGAVLNGPVLLTTPSSLSAALAAEIVRLGPSGILVIGGSAAVSDEVFDQLNAIAPATRIAGSNRYRTAIAISQHAFPGGAGVVYLAVGTNFPDALAGAAEAAYSGSPVLLTPTAELPSEVAAEIQRLDPDTVIILGGTGVISSAVESALNDLMGL